MAHRCLAKAVLMAIWELLMGFNLSIQIEVDSIRTIDSFHRRMGICGSHIYLDWMQQEKIYIRGT